MTYVPGRKHASILIISSSILVCGLGLWLLFGRNCASAQTVKVTKPAKRSTISVTAIGLEVARKVPLYGFNANNTSGPKWSTPGLLKQIKALQPQIIRYPGGAISNWWDWKTGWFINSPNLPKSYQQIPKIPMGLDELKKVVDTTGCEVVFVLNMISASLMDQMSMLEHAQQIGIPVKWIELGNESNLKKSPGMQKFKGPQLYATISTNWTRALRNRFPNAKIGLVGGKTTNGLAVSSWNATVLKEASSTNAIVLHPYPYPANVIDANGIDFKKIYNQFIKTIHTESVNIPKSFPAVWLTEYNIHWGFLKGVSDRKRALSFSKSWSEGLSMVLMTSTATQELPNLKMICDHNLTGWTSFAAIETTQKTFKLLPNGVGMQAWLKAANGMTNMAKIKFPPAIKDYILFGWKFSNGLNQKAILVNLTNSNIKVNLSAINTFNASHYNILYGDKNQQTIGLNSLEKKTGTIIQGVIILPPYSIANIE